MSGLADFYGPNAGYVAELFDRFQQDPEAVDPATRALFRAWESPAATAVLATPPAPTSPDASAAAGAAALAQAVRHYGHLAAQLDPLGSPPPGDPQLGTAAHGISDDDLGRLPAAVVGGPVARTARTAAEAIQQLRRIYCRASGYEFGHVEDPAERSWLLETVESESLRPPADPIDERDLLGRLTEVSAFERFLHRAYPGQTRFSVEGLGMLIPMLDELVDRAAETGTRTLLLGMAHRGRLNVLAHVLGKPYDRVLAEFEGSAPARRVAPSDSNDEGWTGDVKYHAGGRRAYRAADDPGFGSNGDWESTVVTVVMAPNPSHLEAVDPVVQGMARAADERRHHSGAPQQNEAASLAVLIHGDASLPGQGVVAETLNLSQLAGYRVGGTLHLIANNQLGFTTSPSDSRSTLYASDLAKGFEIPVVHVNADDPVACLSAVRLAVAYRGRFHKDFLIDLIGYRRWGHNEGDEPAFTQPRIYRAIGAHPTVRELFAADLVRRGEVPAGEPEALLRVALDEFQRIRESVLARAASEQPTRPAESPMTAPSTVDGVDRAVPRPPTATASGSLAPVSLDALKALNSTLLQFPDGFALNPKLERALQRRRAALDSDRPTIDWGHAETLAFATVLRAGIPIRLTGQDSVRGTFSQRHLTFFDARTGDACTPLERLPGVSASFEARNSPLSEGAALGFEYGYSIQAPDALVIWEAQYGDFVNGAQVIVDEFVVAGEAKWGLTSGLVLLLPHAWEGQGPDHSSGRLERFLQLAAEDNIVVANCTTAAQYFHLLRRQAATLREQRHPLVIMTPKSLLRHELAAASARDLVEGSFHPVLDDPRAAVQPEQVQRIVLCSGKVWADVQADVRRHDAAGLAIIRLEELYPFPADELRTLFQRYGEARQVVWLQEEPRNMGAWPFVEPRLRVLLPTGRALSYVGRPERASPAEGWGDVHAAEQRRLVDAVLQPGEVLSRAD
ncbi:MAG: 2-oxoglutarate dehydrogenase E1 component [Chloroflexi bacterium]|nr:2-oxoglutarate dehydrogenase E1 component [Chloroflexota bacterium]